MLLYYNAVSAFMSINDSVANTELRPRTIKLGWSQVPDLKIKNIYILWHLSSQPPNSAMTNRYDFSAYPRIFNGIFTTADRAKWKNLLHCSAV